jgi:CRISPR-associated protein Csb2
MIAIGMRYLCGWSASMDVSSRLRAEWPPHPGRLYMAMAAAHFETGQDAAERVALEWLEAQSEPQLRCSPIEDVLHSDTVGVYVPVNDVESSEKVLPSLRPKQLRTFPRVRPDNDTVHFLWDSTPGEPIRTALGRLCGKVTRVGHSSSLVQIWIEEEENPGIWPAFVPNPLGKTRMRIPTTGLLRELERAFNGAVISEYQRLQSAAAEANPKQRKKLKDEIRERFPNGEPGSQRPQIGTWQGYSKAEDPENKGAAIPGVFDPNLLIFSRQEGPSLNLESTIQLTGALRDAVMKASPQPPPEWVSGHEPGGTPSQKPHLAFFPLPYVGGEYGDGHVLGIAMAIPRGIDPEEVREQIGPLLFNPQSGKPRTVKLWKSPTKGDDEVWEWEMQREDRMYPPHSLRVETWTGPNREWASVTPVVLHHHPKRNREGHVEAILREACASAGLPEPVTVTTSPVSCFRGAGGAMDVPLFTAGGTSLSRYQVHATLVFEKPVEGPVLVGRGRYRGYGLFRPVESEKGKR